MPTDARVHKPKRADLAATRWAMFALINPILSNIPDNPGASFHPARTEIGYGSALGDHISVYPSSRLALQRTAQKHMRTTEILPEVGVIDAILLFRRLGFDVTGMAPNELRETRRQLINRHHPDRGGSLDMAQAINAAFDLLKDGVPKFRGSAFALGSFRRAHQNRRDQLAALKLCNPDYPEWVWAGCPGDIPGRFDIRAQDFTDINFIKKSLWELSGHSEYEYTIWGFDGRIFRGHVAVFGSPKVFSYMADAMVTFQTKGSNRYECRAVFVHEEASRDLYLIYADGRHYGDAPVKMKHYSFNLNPGNDVDFVRELPELLASLKENFGRDTVAA